MVFGFNSIFTLLKIIHQAGANFEVSIVIEFFD